jgi:hypothetical protein
MGAVLLAVVDDHGSLPWQPGSQTDWLPVAAMGATLPVLKPLTRASASASVKIDLLRAMLTV